MHWSEPYIGLPWQDRGLTRDGVACWGLARLVYAEVLGLDVPDYAAEVASLEDRAEVATVYAEGTMLGPWQPVPEAEAREFDILVFRRAGLDAHVGIVVAPGRMLHITSGQDSGIVSYADGRWVPRLSGVYRHERLIGAVGGVVDGSGGRRPEALLADDEPSPAMVRAGEDVVRDWADIATPDELARRVYAAMVGAKA